MKTPFLLIPVLLATGLVACGGDDEPGSAQGQMKLAVTDAPADGAQQVVVRFTGVELTRSNGEGVDIDFAAPRSIDLLAQSGTASAVLFDRPVPAGSYGQIRLKVLADGDPADSFIQLSDGTVHGLRIPSGSQTGLKLVSGFQVPEGGIANYTIDFDLRKAITCPPGQAPACLLKPALRLIADNSVGNIAGVIDPALVAPVNCTPAVYLYAGAGITPDDYGSPAEPLASNVVVQTPTGLRYQLTFLPPGSYTAAFTCQAGLDDVEADDPIAFGPIKGTITVTAGQTTTVDFP